VIHHERPGTTELMPERESRADGAAGVTCRRLDVHSLKRGRPTDFAVSDRIHGAPSRQGQIRERMTFVHSAKQIEEGFLVHRLHRARDVAMPLLERIVWSAAWAQQILKRRAEQVAEFR
jgi:hypothetical protein